jgi:MFS family permease
VIGALIGAPVVEAFGWRWIFVAQAPLMAGCCLVVAAVLPDLPVAATNGDRKPRLDGWGALTLGLGCVSLLLAVNRGPVWGWRSPGVVGGIAVAVALFVTFVNVERRVEHPLLPLAYTRRRAFTIPILSQFCTNFAYMGAFAITPLLLQNEFDRTATASTWLSIPRPLVFAIAGPIAGYLIIRVGERAAGAFGAAAITASMVALAAVDGHDGDWVIVASVALSGLGMGAASPAMATSIANAVDDADLGIAGATQQMVSQVGVAVGIQVMLAVQTGREAAVGAVSAYGDAYLVGAALAFVGVLLALLMPKARHRPGRDEARPLVVEEAGPEGVVIVTR